MTQQTEAGHLARLVERLIDEKDELVRENARLEAMLAGASKVDDDQLLRTAEAAELLGMDAETVRRLAKEGEIPGARKVGRMWRYSRRALVTWRR